LGRGTDRDWEVLGQLEPCWAVLTHDAFRGPAVTDAEKLELFLASGRQHVARIWDVIESNLGGRFTPDRALDFGCGVGRIVVPLAERCGSVLGVDVADSMLANARLLCQQRNLSNVRFARCDDSLEGVDGGFDLVHSYIVFQHVPPGRGLPLLERLLGKLNANGVGVIHVLYDNPDMASLPASLLKNVWRTLKRPFRRVPQMQMNAYSLNQVYRIIQDSGVRQIHVLPTDHGGCLGLVLCFRKVPNAPYLA
jgi:2-polyprenyl-3-methyl-5-hydroxy-6-metoxy-1,4-benzoquinol methylase